MNVRLTRLTKTNKSGSLRGEGIEGFTASLPIVGEPFRVWHERPTGDFRIVQTSPVTFLDENEFTTLTGSVYKVEVL